MILVKYFIYTSSDKLAVVMVVKGESGKSEYSGFVLQF